MTLRPLFGLFLACTVGCGEDDFCGYPPQWEIGVTDDPAPLTDQPGEPVARLDVRHTERCKRTLALDEFYVSFDVPDYSIGKTTRAVHPENLLLAELVDEDGDGRLGGGEALLLGEGPNAAVPPGVQWTVWLMLASGNGGSGMASAVVVIQ